jgi:hypothetical protein
VERIPSEGRGQSAKFIPIRYYFANKLTRDHKLLLAFNALVLAEMLGRRVGIGKIIHGDHRDTLKGEDVCVDGRGAEINSVR